LNPKSLTVTWEEGKWNRVHGDKKSSAKGRLHAETILMKDGKRKVKLVYNNDILFICDVQNVDAVAGLRGERMNATVSDKRKKNPDMNKKSYTS
jgi:hypothetical protein